MLRDGLEYAGTVVSDALDRAGVHGAGLRPADITPAMIGHAAVASIVAGCDALCLGARQGADVPAAVVRAIVEAVCSGDLPVERLSAAVRATAALRSRVRADGNGEAEAADRSLMHTVARRAVTGAPPPLARGAVVVDCRPPVSIANFDVAWGLAADMAALDPSVVGIDATDDTPAGTVVDAAVDRPLVLAVRGAAAHPWQRRFVDEIAALRPDVVVVELGWPDERHPATISTWGASRGSTRAVAELLVAG
jgi:beta-N-acetylhexosaminidase